MIHQGGAGVNSTGGEEREGGTVQCAARMSPVLYADEEGRATMTRDDGRGPGPVRLEPKEIHPPRKGCRGARRRARRRTGGRLPALARAWHQRACPPPAPPSRHAYVLRVHTLTCHHRVETELIEVNLLLSLPPPPPSPAPLPGSSKARKSNVPSSSETQRRDALLWRLASRKSLVRIQPASSS